MATPYRFSLRAALALFVLAGLTGALLRYGMLYGFPFELQFTNVRHAHSHLMYFGWVTPALFSLIAAALPRLTGRPAPRGFGAVIGLTLVLALAAFVPFLLSGYQRTSIGELRLPLSTILAGLNMLAWYGFVAVYLINTWGVQRTIALAYFDAALYFLLLASLGAWGLAVSAFAPFASPDIMEGLVAFFLELFSHGWFAAALLGLLYLALPRVGAGYLPAAGLGLFVSGLTAASLGNLLAEDLLAMVGRLVTALGLALMIVALGRASLAAKTHTLSFVLILLGFKVLVDFGLIVAAVAAWFDHLGLHLLFLHGYLLGFVSLALVALTVRAENAASFWRLAAAVVLFLASLIPLTGLWPAPWRGRWVLDLALWAVLPVGVAAVALLGSWAWSARETPLGVEPDH